MRPQHLALGLSTVVLLQAIDPATLTAATFQVRRAGAPLAAALSRGDDGKRGYYTSLAVDGGGRVHVSYYDIANLDLKHIE